MLTKHVFFFLTILVFELFSFIIGQASGKYCNQTCGKIHVPCPFGFSSGCNIRLNCSSEGEVLIDEFLVQTIGQETIKLSLQAKCQRPLHALRQLFAGNYAPTSKNAILMHNCTSISPCNIPGLNVETHFQLLNCSGSSNTSCFSNETVSGYFNYSTMTSISRCNYLLSSILAQPSNSTSSGMSLEVQAMELRWWLKGECQVCSKHADCIKFGTPSGQGYRCQCGHGLVGDGYLSGKGCHRGCNIVEYLSGQCRGKTRFAVLTAGIIVGAILMISLGLFCCFIRRNSTSKSRSLTKCGLPETAAINIPIYPYKEIEKATNSFSDKQRLGTGAYGTVYAGKLCNDSWVAIKRIKNRGTDSIEQVINEIKLISLVNHPNLVRLLGCSIENGEQILVYEFMPNGTLCQHLQRERGDGLAWPIRLSIAAETAQAIAHLHSAIDPPIYHRDIKSSNILLDYNFRSKVADFGLSRLGETEISHISTAPQGTPGYLDPQYHQNFHLSDKSDVYSFGVVLIEIITALKVVDFSRPPNEVNLAALAVDRIGNARLDEIIDPFLETRRDSWILSTVNKVAELAFRCLAFDRDMRPSMMEVAGELEVIRLSRWAHSEEMKNTASVDVSPSSSSSNISERPLNLWVKNSESESRSLFVMEREESNEKSMEKAKRNSPVSVQDTWLSEQSSTSSNSFVNVAKVI